MSIRDLLKDISNEAAAVDMPMEGPIEQLDEAMMTAGDATTMPTVAGEVSTAVQAGELAEQFQDLEQRADALEEKAAAATSEVEQQIVQVSAECLVREFDTLITSYGMRKDWHSYSIEASQSPMEQIKAVKAEAQKYGELTKKTALAIGDISNESSGIAKVLGRHKANLATARAALQNATRRVEAALSDLREHPHVIRNDGLRRFMTRNGHEVTNLPEAIHAESEWLSKAHTACVSAIATIKAAAAKIKANPELKLADVVTPANFKAFRELTTAKGYLMGNHTVEIKKDPGIAPYYKRVNENVTSGKAAAVGAAIAPAGFIASSNLAALASLAIGGVAMGPILLAGAAGAIGLGTMAARGVDNTSKVQSAASANDLKKVLTTVLGYDKYTADNMDWAIFDELEGHAGSGLDQLHNVAWAVYVMLEIIYDQALYTTLRMASLAKSIS